MLLTLCTWGVNLALLLLSVAYTTLFRNPQTNFYLYTLILSQTLLFISLFNNNYSITNFIALLFTFLILGILISLWWQESTSLTIQQKHAYSNKQLTRTKLLISEYYFILVTLAVIFIALSLTNNLWAFYLYFEFSSILLLILFAFNLNWKYIKGATLYLFISFYSTLYLTWGFLFLYSYSGLTIIVPTQKLLGLTNVSIPPVSYTNPTTLYLGLFFIILAFIVKLGVFPYHTWVLYIYTNLTKQNLLVMLTLTMTGYWLSFIGLLTYLVAHLTTNSHTLVIMVLVVCAVISSLVGSLLLFTETRISGVLACNSIVTNGFLLLVITGLLVLLKPTDLITLFWLVVLYLITYNLTTLIIYNSWSAFNLYTQLQQELQNSQTKVQLYWRSSTSWLLTHKDYYFYLLLCIFFGFPPFLLFIVKFYLTLYVIIAGLFWPLWFILLTLNIILTGAVCRILTLLTIKLKLLV